MLIVNNNSGNTLCVTASEQIYITGTTGYTLTLTNNTTLEVFSGITLTDSSSYTDRYNLFNLTLTGSSLINYSQAKVYLQNGFYDYEIYNGTQLLENGFMKVMGPAQVTTYVYPKRNQYVTYKKQ